MRVALIAMYAAVMMLSSPSPQEKIGPPPRYAPPRLLAANDESGASGTIVLEVTLDDAGKVIEVRTLRGIPSLAEQADHAVRQWTFQPAQFNGRPVPSRIPVVFSFAGK